MNQLEKLRSKLDLNQSDMAKLMRCTQGRVSDIEKGRRGITKLMSAYLAALERLHELGELQDFQKKIQ